jgi:hypothetical protein
VALEDGSDSAKSGFERLNFKVKVERRLNSRCPVVINDCTIM